MSSKGPASDKKLGAPCTRDGQLHTRGICPGVRICDRVRIGVGVVGKEAYEDSRLEGTFSFPTRSRLEATDPRDRVDRVLPLLQGR